MKYKAVLDEGGIHDLFVLQWLIEMVKVRKDDIYLWRWDIEKAYYDSVNRKKLFEIIRCYGVHETFVGLILMVEGRKMVVSRAWENGSGQWIDRNG